MASTTSTLPAAMASPAAEQSSGTAHGTILALDLGTTTGWALQRVGAIISGTVSFRPSRYDGGGVRYLRFRAGSTALPQTLAASVSQATSRH